MFNNGLNSFYPYPTSTVARPGLLGAFKGKFNWSSLLNNTQKTLNIINQAIPVFYQVRPIWNNTKTVFKILGAVKDDGSNQNRYNNAPVQNQSKKTNTFQNEPQKSTYESNINQNIENTPNFFL